MHPFAEALADIDVDDGTIPVVSCASVRPFRDVRTELAAALIKPVRWRETMIALVARGASTFIDAGPGSGARKARPTLRARASSRRPSNALLRPPTPHTLDPNQEGITTMATTKTTRRTSRPWSSSRSPASAPTPRR